MKNKFKPGDRVLSKYKKRWYGVILSYKGLGPRQLHIIYNVLPILTPSNNPQPKSIKPRWLHGDWLEKTDKEF